jgi:DNA-binding FadR family transcriptional regulator
MAVAATDPDLGALDLAEELIGGMDVAVDDVALHASTDIRVHRALLGVCRNELLRESAGELLDLVLDPMLVPARAHAWSSHDRPQDWVGQHRAVCAALRSGDAAAARAFSRDHLVSVLRGLAEVDQGEPGLPERVDRIVRLAQAAPEPAPRGARGDVPVVDREVRDGDRN